MFVYTRTGNRTLTLGTARAVSHGGSRLFQFDRSGKFVREIGQGAYGLLQAQQVRVDRQDNVWIVDRCRRRVIKFDPNGRVRMILSRKPEAMRVPRPAARHAWRPDFRSCSAVVRRRRPRPGAWSQAAAAGKRAVRCRARASRQSFQRPTDVAWDTAGNIYVADGYGNARIAKYEPGGKFIKIMGIDRAGHQASSTSCTALPSTRRGTFTSQTRETGESRCSTATERSNGSF